MMRLAWSVSPLRDWDLSRLELEANLENVTGRAGARRDHCPYRKPEARCRLCLQVWKCIVSLGPMLSRIRKTSRLVTC